MIRTNEKDLEKHVKNLLKPFKKSYKGVFLKVQYSVDYFSKFIVVSSSSCFVCWYCLHIILENQSYSDVNECLAVVMKS